MRTLLSFLLILLCIKLANAQVVWNMKDTSLGAWYTPYVSHDNAGNVYVGIQNQSSIKKIRKISATGQLIWERLLPVNDNYRIIKIETRLDGVSYLIAEVYDTSGNIRGLCARLEPSGSMAWIQQVDSIKFSDLRVHNGAVFFTGAKRLNANVHTSVVIAADIVTGERLWYKEVTYAADVMGKLVIAADGDIAIVVVRSSGKDLFTARLSAADGALSNSVEHEFADNLSQKFFIAGDKQNNVCVLLTRSASGFQQTMLVKLLRTGGIMWDKPLVSSEINYGSCLALDSKNSMYVTYHTQGTTLNNSRAYLAKCYGNGVLQWAIHKPDTVKSYSSIFIKNDNLFVGSLCNGLLIEKMDTTGQVLDSVRDNEGLYPVIDIDEEGSLLAGSQYHENDLMIMYGSYVAKYGLLLSINETDNVAKAGFALYPNPVQINGNVFFTETEQPKRVAVYDIEGRVVVSANIQQGEKHFTLPPQMVPGIYIIELRTANQNSIQKLVIQE
ncbi:MAG TPA: T9SS type A sorting domain-containing protein [Chitinophagales bacterium]|nr:T9SS type A sorting domain-containing protein [Chitinophagales bacterium]